MTHVIGSLDVKVVRNKNKKQRKKEMLFFFFRIFSLGLLTVLEEKVYGDGLIAHNIQKRLGQ
jgi:hypothetical protein